MCIIVNDKIFKPYDDMYYVSCDGDVYSTYSNKILKPHVDLDGYLRVDIHGKHMKVHKLVYLTWVSRELNGLQINHKDDNKLNNHYTNLYAGTQKENIHDCIRNNHREGNKWYLTVLDKEKGEILTFSPASDFIPYSGHSCKNGGVKRVFSRNWFKKRFEIIDYKKKGVTTKGDECSLVG